MKNKLLLDALREVRHTYSRFLSILVLAALAVAFLAGLRATQPDMEWTVDRYFDRQKLMDVRVVSTLGLTPEDITALDAEEDVAAAEGAWTVDAMIAAGDKEHVVKLHSLSKNGLNAPVLREGRLPEDVSECVTEERFLQASGLKLGDRVTMNTGDGAFEEALVRQEFTIVGVADSPLYLFDAQRGTSSLGTGRVSAFFLLEEEAFDMDFTDAYLLLDGADTLVCYSDAYDNMAEDAMDGLEPLGDVRAPLRREELVATANEKLDDAQKEYDDAKAEADDKIATAEADLADARKKLDDAQRELDDGYVTLARESADGQQELDDAAVKLTDARLTLDENEVKYRDGVAELADGKAELADAEKKLADAKLELEDGKKELDDAKKELDDAKLKLEDGKKEYADGLQTFTEKKQEFEDGKAEYEKGVKEYEDGKGKYEDGLKEYQDAKVTLDDAKKELDKAEGKLKKAKEQLAAGSAEYDRGVAEYNRQKAAFDGSVAPLAALFGQSSGDALFGALDAAEQAGSLGAMISGVWGGIDAQRQQLLGIINAPVGTPGITDEMRQQAEAGLKQLPESQGALEGLVAQARGGNAQLTAAKGQLDAGGAALSSGSGAYQAGKLEYQKGKAEYEDGLKKWQESAVTLQDAKDELDKGALKLADAKAALSDGQRQLDDAEIELADAKKELADGETKYAEGETKYQDGVTEYQDGLAEYEDGAAEYADGAAEIADAERELVDARQKLDDGTREYNDGKAEYEDGVLTLAKETAKAKRKLADGELELRDGEKDYAKGYAEYLDGKDEAEEKLFDARQKLGDARHKIADIEDCEWYFLGRKTNAGFVSYQNDAERIGNLASVFPIIFFLVAALVCLTTMTRMVEEQRVQIGGMKALGYSRGQIAFKYVGYGFSASLLGGIAGLAMGLTVIPTIIYNAWGTLYTLPPLRLEFVPAVSLMSLGAAVVTVTGAALAASFGVLSAVPAELMRPKAPAAGKRVLLERITPLWKRLSFSLKVAVRNLFRYKKRFWMTVIGIGGCTALIIVGFGLRDSILSVVDRQYVELNHYESQVALTDDTTLEERQDVEEGLGKDENVAGFLPCYQVAVTVENAAGSMDATVFAAEDPEKLPDFVTLRDRAHHEPVPVREDGMVVTEKMAKVLDIKVGDKVTLDDGDRRFEVEVSGITENYLSHFLYGTQDYYNRQYGEERVSNLYLCRYVTDTPQAEDEVAARMMQYSGVTAMSSSSVVKDAFAGSIESVDYAVLIIIIAAAALALVVLYNLTNINITERIRELATLKVLGFYDGELSAYVYRENIFLTIFGILAGLLMGFFLHRYVITTVEIDMLMFVHSAKPLSYLYAILLTALFSLVVNLGAHRRLKKIDMVESLKTVE